mmetsp:Transcript_1669/g.3064  ORF Transcript_1669/g.3064 Transcript_1669/m.3064 type:complete len:201 (+) Transcript_1669:9741-10343(+)
MSIICFQWRSRIPGLQMRSMSGTSSSRNCLILSCCCLAARLVVPLLSPALSSSLETFIIILLKSPASFSAVSGLISARGALVQYMCFSTYSFVVVHIRSRGPRACLISLIKDLFSVDGISRSFSFSSMFSESSSAWSRASLIVVICLNILFTCDSSRDPFSVSFSTFFLSDSMSRVKCSCWPSTTCSRSCLRFTSRSSDF